MMEVGVELFIFFLILFVFDQVFVGNMDLFRMYGIFCIFVLGVNDGVLFVCFDENGVLLDDDWEWLKMIGIEFFLGGWECLFDEYFFIYMVFFSLFDWFYVLYLIVDVEGKMFLLLIVIKWLEELFLQYKEWLLINEFEQVSDEEQFMYVVNKSVVQFFIVSQFRLWIWEYDISDVWWSMYNVLMSELDRL